MPWSMVPRPADRFPFARHVPSAPRLRSFAAASAVAAWLLALGGAPMVRGDVGREAAAECDQPCRNRVASRACTNLVQDPGFESGVAGFEAQDASSAVFRSTEAPLDGAASLRLAINGYGNNIWWIHPFEGGRARHLQVSAHLRSDTASTSDLQFCAMAYYADSTTAEACTTVRASLGDKGTIAADLDLDETRLLSSVRIRAYQEGSAPVRFTLDTVNACLDVVQAPPGGRWRRRRWR